MKATNLIIGQKYTYRQNSEVTRSVTYLGSYEYPTCTGYDFEYLENGEIKTTVLFGLSIERDLIKAIN